MDTTGGKKVTKKTKDKLFLPDEIVVNILMRLPAKNAMRCRLVCRGWRDLTSSRYFVDLNLISSISTILVAHHKVSRLDFFALDKWWERDLFALGKWWERAGTSLSIHKFSSYSEEYYNKKLALFSHGGLIVLKEDAFHLPEARFIILNPARPNNECVKINIPKRLHGSKIYGVYFNPSLKEYCSLWEICKSGQPKQIQYMILNLGCHPSLKTISNPFSNRVMKWGAIPLYMDNHLYWMLYSDKYGGRNDIMVFDIIREEFMVMPCPIPMNTECKHYQTYLLNINGVLSFLLIDRRKIIIWRLEDHAAQLWTADEYTLTSNLCSTRKTARGIAIVDGMLAFKFGSRLLVCNLMDGKVKSCQTEEYCSDVSFLSHQVSLASLSNCKHTIEIYQDNNVDTVVAV